MTFGAGKVDRNWSFSDNSSLILSSNARPINSVFAKLENNFNLDFLPQSSRWSVEAFNGSTKGSKGGKNSMLFGTRITISPSDRLNFELLQTSQWDAENNKLGTSTLGTILLGNSNEGHNSKINKMAGFGLSYLIPTNKNTYRIYGQMVGEDEAGNLPSCFGWLAGLELSMPKIIYPTTTTIEYIDTRVKKSSNGNCGPNTMYNNSTYSYTNYGTALGATVDSEGTSFGLSAISQLNNALNIKYSMKLLTINDKNYSQHRLSSDRNVGSISSIGITWAKNNFYMQSSINYQNLILGKANLTNGISVNLSSKLAF